MNATLARLSRLGTDPPADDGSLIDAFLAGDQSAFAALVRRHAALVFATCRRVLRHQQDAEDAFQATFLVLARRAADVWPREALGAWLFGVAHRVAVKARAVRARKADRQKPLEEVAATDSHAPDCDLADAVHRVVCRLPEVYRAAVVACDLEGLSRREAAERLGWSEGTLSGRLARARELLATRFRRAGLSLPAGGLAAVFATAGGASAGVLQQTIVFATGGAACAPAPVAALTEGVVRSMALVKLKTVAAAVFVACAIGFGTVAIGAGVGDGDDKGGGRKQSQTQSQGGAPAVAPKVAAPAPNPLTDRERLQGEWRVVSLTEDGKTTLTNPSHPWVVEVAGDTLAIPFREPDGWKQKQYAFVLGEAKGVKTIDLSTKTAPIGCGLYEFAAPAKACIDCHAADPKNPFLRAPTDMLPLCPGGLKVVTPTVRLAISIDGKRPEKFGGGGVIVFEMLRLSDPKSAAPRVGLARQELDALRQELEQAAKNKLDADAVARLLARLKAAEALLGEEPKPKPAPPTADADRERLTRAAAELQRARADVEAARARVAETEAVFVHAQRNLKAAEALLKAAEKAAADARPTPAPADAPTFTIHVRPLAAPEKVARAKATGTQTVLDALAHADGVSLKPDAVSVWVVRDGVIMPVDLAAITANGDAKTNYQLKAGDRLFVQVKAAK